MADLLGVLMRWVHICSVATLIGGVLYAREVLWPGEARLAPEVREGLDEFAAARFRPLVMAAIAGLVISGLYILVTHPGHTPLYHMLLGIKLLLALHVFAVTLIAVQPHRKNRARLLTGAAISGLTIILIASYLRRIF